MGRFPRALLGALFVLSLSAAGCGKSEEKLAPVRGKVYYRGEPVQGGTIVFAPDADRGGHGPIAHAEIGADGSFSLRTDGEPGATPGWHRVTVAGTSIPARYCDPELSRESREVKAAIINDFDIRLE